MTRLRKYSAAFWLDIAVKAALICLLAFGAFSGLQQFEGKGFLWRLSTYPIAALVIPVIWALLSGAIGTLVRRTSTGAWETLALVVGFGAVTAILWEIAEYFAFIRHSPELTTAYSDTLGDLTLGLAGSCLAGLAAALAPRPQRV